MSLQPEHRLLEVKAAGDVTIAQITTRCVDESNVEAFGERLFNLTQNGPCHTLQLDFNEVEYLNSTALAKLGSLDQKVRTAGGKLTLVNVNADVYERFT